MSQPNQKHVFVSHAHKDSAPANAIVAALEHRGVPCWIAPRNVPPGGSYAEAILTAIETASCFVLIYSEHSNVSSHVLREVERALKFGVNIVPVRFDDSAPSKSLDYLLATVHWLAIPAESRDHSIARAAEQIAGWLTNFLKNPATPLPVRASTLQTALITAMEPPRKRTGMVVGTGVLLALLGVGAYAAGYLPFAKHADSGNAASASDSSLTQASTVLKPSAVPSPVSIEHVRPAKIRRPLGYAGVNDPPAARKTAPVDNNAGANQAPPPLPDRRLANPNAMQGPPPPPSYGPGNSQYHNGMNQSGPPDGRFGPPPPPGGPGRPMFGPNNRSGPGHPPPPPPGGPSR